MRRSLRRCNPNRSVTDKEPSTATAVTNVEQDAAMSEKIGNEDQQVPAMTRRTALAVAAVAPLSIGSAAAAEPVAQLVAGAAEKNAAFMRGDMQRWSELVRIAADFTLMQP